MIFSNFFLAAKTNPGAFPGTQNDLKWWFGGLGTILSWFWRSTKKSQNLKNRAWKNLGLLRHTLPEVGCEALFSASKTKGDVVENVTSMWPFLTIFHDFSKFFVATKIDPRAFPDTPNDQKRWFGGSGTIQDWFWRLSKKCQKSSLWRLVVFFHNSS